MGRRAAQQVSANRALSFAGGSPLATLNPGTPSTPHPRSSSVAVASGKLGDSHVSAGDARRSLLTTSGGLSDPAPTQPGAALSEPSEVIMITHLTFAVGIAAATLACQADMVGLLEAPGWDPSCCRAHGLA
jgi:hypothetical protein